VVAPAGTPPAIVACLNGEITKALQSADIKERIDDQGLDLKPGLDPPSWRRS
jgi:tripartite-type tricarboxylate transporter receptor subunit TctC